ncbi:MAG: NfeD family protein [Methylomonas sp.]|nr:NfeD family protein [Methylomonas sp.]PPD22210.1 MAG: hypothetical protein CTY23_02585 [Methylomonas sp.]PPD27747.1 MAG: hypothetical protein CTY22_00875 [Methylomonas sp.]PPD39758.1 MAG: hypothetical protein CTY21_00870 [Methylomonas sp.]PPD42531.1 MAG: hypothetical protein CTY17_00765 [Methylomonas sp.]
MAEWGIEFWYWWVAAAGFLVIELLVSGFFFIWLAVSAFVVGSLLLVMPGLSFEGQLLLFSVLAVASILVWRRFMSAKAQGSDQPLLNRRGQHYIGRSFTLVEAIDNGRGKIKVDDTFWRVEGQDCKKGSKVRVIAVRGMVLDVEPCD